MRINTIILAFLCLFQTSNITASNIVTKTDSIIFKAMQDEMNRNMNELTYNHNPNPFFISYTISDANTLLINSSNGAVINSNKNHSRGWSARVIVGDYKLNDENYRGFDIPNNNANFYNVSIPLEDDYFGIRRALWIATNNIYKSASAKYKSKMNILNEKGVEDSLLLNDFCKVPKVELIQTSEEFNLDKSHYEVLSRELSAIFRKYPDVYSSSVTIGISNINIYFIGVFTYLQQLLYYKTNAHFGQPSPLFCEILFACK